MARIKDNLLRRQERKLEPASLGALADVGVRIFCRCNRCGHTASLDARRLSEDLGAAIPVPEVGGKLRCTGCNGMDISTRPAWPGLAGRNHADNLDEPETPPAILS